MCPDGGSGCSCKGPTEIHPPIRLPIELTAAGDASSGALASGVQPVAGQVSVAPPSFAVPTACVLTVAEAVDAAAQPRIDLRLGCPSVNRDYQH